MKNKDLVFYAIVALSLSIFVIPPLAAELSFADSFPGFELCLEWIKAGEQFVLSGF